jgi:hypothetical protein
MTSAPARRAWYHVDQHGSGWKYISLPFPHVCSLRTGNLGLAQHHSRAIPLSCTNHIRFDLNPHEAGFRCSRAPLSIYPTQLSQRLAKPLYNSGATGLVTNAQRVRSKPQILLQPYNYVGQSTRTRLHIDNRPHTANSINVIGCLSAYLTLLHKGESSIHAH